MVFIWSASRLTRAPASARKSASRWTREAASDAARTWRGPDEDHHCRGVEQSPKNHRKKCSKIKPAQNAVRAHISSFFYKSHLGNSQGWWQGCVFSTQRKVIKTQPIYIRNFLIIIPLVKILRCKITGLRNCSIWCTCVDDGLNGWRGCSHDMDNLWVPPSLQVACYQKQLWYYKQLLQV